MPRSLIDHFIGFLVWFLLAATLVSPQFAAADDGESIPARLSEIHDAISVLFPNSKLEVKQKQNAAAYLLVNDVLAGSPIQLELLDDSKPNAFAIPSYRSQSGTPRIILTSGLNSLLINKSELAFVIAHEISHLREDHFSPDLPAITLTSSQLRKIVQVHQSWEMSADRSAVEMLHRRGLDARAGLHLLGRLHEFESESEHTLGRNHPSISERLDRLNSQIAQILP